MVNNLLSFLKYIFSIKETNLAYFYGIKINELDYLKKCESKYVFTRILVFIKTIIIRTSLSADKLKKSDVLLYAGTKNQYDSLVGTAESVGKFYSDVIFFLEPKISKEITSSDFKIKTVTFSLFTSFTSLLIFLLKVLPLYIALKKQKNNIGISCYFEKFCMSYVYVPYFYLCIKKIQPKFVIISNDHSVECRCLLLVASKLKIKTVYLQHASVSYLFPPLEFDYAFLDGVKSLDIYEYISAQKNNKQITNIENDDVKIFLSGQKKSVFLSGAKKNDGILTIGIAANSLDDYYLHQELISELVKHSIPTVIRFHPNQSDKFVKSLHEFGSNKSNVTLSLPAVESLDKYFAKCDLIIAGNSSIHLEAQIAGVPTYYMEFDKSNNYYDYYRYIEEGITELIGSSQKIQDISNNEINNILEARKASIMKYSETYSSVWQHNEGMLVAKTLSYLSSKSGLDELYYRSDISDCFEYVYRLNTRQFTD